MNLVGFVFLLVFGAIGGLAAHLLARDSIVAAMLLGGLGTVAAWTLTSVVVRLFVRDAPEST
jgi:hypothetical protein